MRGSGVVSRPRAEQRVWDLEHPDRTDPDLYRREIIPGVEQMSLKAIQRATGLSAGYSTKIRRGEVVPHPRWWDAMWSTHSGQIDRLQTPANGSGPLGKSRAV